MSRATRFRPRSVLAFAAGVGLLQLSLLAQSPPAPGWGSVTRVPPVPPAAARSVVRAPAAAAEVRAGERLYREGLSVAGSAVSATLQGDVHVESTAMPCVNCHRRSGMGSAEGPLVVPPVLGSVLFVPVTRGAPQLGTPRTTGAGTRPAYTEQALLDALRDGVDPAGRPLSATMPRYSVGEADVRALSAYLRALGAEPPPGVDDAIVHLATIVTPRVSAARRASMLDVLRAFVRAKNGGTRYEVRRREQGPWDMKRMYEGYRDWVLDEWELHGAPAEWPAELERLYRLQPVFAIVAGIADEDWSPVDAFCARHGIPAVLPETPLPPARPADAFYSFYFTRGVTLDAQAIANHLEAAAGPPTPEFTCVDHSQEWGRSFCFAPDREPEGSRPHLSWSTQLSSGIRVVRQVSRCGTPGHVAAMALARELEGRVSGPACIPAAATLSAEAWRTVIGDADTLVAWLDASDLQGLEALAGSTAIDRLTAIYLSSSLLGESALRVPEGVASRATLVHPFVPPDEFDAHARRTLMWLKANGLAPADRPVAVNALFAVVLAADALSVPGAIGSREYFAEIIEHMAGRSLHPSVYPSVSFDPVHRFASAGCYLLKMPAAAGGTFRKVEEWHAPKS